MAVLNRRQALGTLSLGAGGMLLSPLARQIEAQAAGVVNAKRFVFVIEGNGCQPGQVQPKGIVRKTPNGRPTADKLVDLPLAKEELPFALEPLTPFKDRLTIVQGLSGRICGGGHSNNFGALGVYSAKKGAYGETIDAALAKALPGIFPHVGLGITDRDHSVVYNCSASGPGKALPVQCRPDLAFNALFGSVAQGTGKQQFDAQRNVLDFMVNDVKRLEKSVAGPEREKVDSYLQAFESLRQRQSRINEIQHTLRKHAPEVSDKYTSKVETDRLDAQFDLAAAALISGLTNVSVLASGVGDPYFGIAFKGLGIDLGKHGIGHGGSFNGKGAYELSSTIRRFHIELMARLAGKLKAVPEGDGTMLDNTCIIYMSDAAESHHSRCWEWPFVILGNLGGKLKTNGRYLEYPAYGKKGHRTIGSLYATLLHAAGAPRDRFGLADPELKDLDMKGPLNELLA